MLPYLVVSIFLVVVIMLVSSWHFGVAFYQLPALALVCLLFPALLARTRLVDLGVLAHTNASDTVFRFLSVAGVCALRSIRATRTTAQSDPVYFRTFSAYSFLPRFSAGEHVSRRVRNFMLTISWFFWLGR